MTHKWSDVFRFMIRPSGLLTVAGVVAGTASLLGFFGSLNWLLDLFSHFRVQYFLALAVITLPLLILRRRKTAAFFGTLALVNLGVVLPLYFGSIPEAACTGHSVRAMLVNVNTEFGNMESVADAISQFDPDIVVLEEVSTEWLSKLRPVLAAYNDSKCEPREDNFGIALYSKRPFTHSQIVDIGDAGVPSVVAEVDTACGKCTVLATHPLPPAGPVYSRQRDAQLAALPQHILRATSPVLLLGDLNVSPWSSHFGRLLQESRLKDSSQGRGVQPTWPTLMPLLLIPIDHCLHSPQISILRKEVGPTVGSDHYPLIVDFLIATE